jgi:hypothetical protein
MGGGGTKISPSKLLSVTRNFFISKVVLVESLPLGVIDLTMMLYFNNTYIAAYFQYYNNYEW